MARFTTRVELHDAQYYHYATLHAEMQSRGFARTITSDDGVVYEMPWAEYNYEGAETREGLLQRAKYAVAKTGKNAAILVTESNGRTWHGLNQA